MELGSGPGPDRAEPFDRDPCLGDGVPEMFPGAMREMGDADAGGRATKETAAQQNRLAGHDGRVGATGLGRGPQHPGHRLLPGADVGRGDVDVGADDGQDGQRVEPGHLVELTNCQRRRVAVDAALGAAEGQTVQRGLPGHQPSQRSDVVERDPGPEPGPALGRPQGVGVLHPVPGQHRHRPVVSQQGQFHDERPAGAVQSAHGRFVQVQGGGHSFETLVLPCQQSRRLPGRRHGH